MIPAASAEVSSTSRRIRSRLDRKASERTGREDSSTFIACVSAFPDGYIFL